MKYFFCSLALLSLMFLNSCRSEENCIPNIELFSNNDSVFEIKQWLLIGPFIFDTISQSAEETFKNPDNLPYEFDENGIDIKTIKKLKEKQVKVFYANRKNALVNFLDYVNGSINDKSNFYAFSNIISQEEKEMIMVCDGCSNYSIWLNGSKIVEVKGRYNTFKLGDRFTKVKLQKGNNLIFAKINRGNSLDAWKLIVGLTAEIHAKKIYVLNYKYDFIHKPIVENELEIYLGPFNSGEVVLSNSTRIFKEVFNSSNIKNDYVNIKLPTNWPNGFYTCQVHLKDNTIEQVFYKGNFKKFYNNILAEKEALSFETIVKQDLNSQFERLEYLECLEKTNRIKIDEHLFELNRVEWGKQILGTIEFAKSNKCLKNNPGTQLRCFIDKNSGLPVTFLFHIDKKILDSHKKFPIVLVAISDSISNKLVNSPYLANLAQLKEDASLASEKGFAICWLFLKGNKFTLRQGVDEVERVISNLIGDYPLLDETAVFFTGEGLGGQRAMLLTQMQPDKYAGLAIYNPFVVPRHNNENPSNFVGNLINLQVLLLHGQKFDECTLYKFREFVINGNRLGLRKLSFKQTKNGQLEFSINYNYPIFDFFAKTNQVLPFRQPDIVRLKTFDNSFNSFYWLKYFPVKESSKSEIVAHFYPFDSRFNIKCVNVKSVIIDSRKLEIIDSKKMQYSIEGNKRNIIFNKDGKIEISIISKVNKITEQN